MKVSVVISNRNDVIMLAITLRNCLEELRPIPESDIVVCDNSDAEIYPHVQTVIPQKYIKSGKIKLLRQEDPCLFTAREAAIRASSAEYIFCIDGHMIQGRDAILDCVNFMDRKNDPKIGFAHAPLCWAHQHENSAKHDRDLTKGELGPWGVRRDTEQKITWKGMPWLCRREWFLNELGGYGALSQHNLAWGGGDMHIGTKSWLLGFENWAVPTAACIHLGPWPNIPADIHKYRLYGKSGNGVACFGFLVSCFVLGGEPMMERNRQIITEKFKHFKVESNWKRAMDVGAEERRRILADQTISYEDYLTNKPWEN